MKNHRKWLLISWNACLLFWSLRVPVLIHRLTILNNVLVHFYSQNVSTLKDKAIAVQASAGHAGSRWLRLPRLYTLFHETNPGS
jgi:hypothetical protein